jgi:hypothetical protein
MKKKTLNEFLKQANDIHHSFYDYSRVSYIECKSKVVIVCPIHGEFFQTPEKHLNGRGCKLCGIEKSKKTILEKYGVDNVFKSKEIKDKIKKTNIKKYGVKSPIQNKDIREKIEKTNIKRFGCKNVFSNREIMGNALNKRDYKSSFEKSKKTCLKKYGVDNYFKSDLSKNKLKTYKKEQIVNGIFDGIRLKNKVIPLFKEEDYIDVQSKYRFKCCTCDNDFIDNLDDGKLPRCPNCFPYIINSKFEYEILDFLKTVTNKEIVRGNRKLLNGLELDFYIPELKLAIEFDGLYYHSEITGGKDKNYHLNKLNICETLGIKLIHIFEDEWRYKKNIVKSRLQSILNCKVNSVYARKCIVKEIDSNTANIFLEDNHLQGKDNSKIKLGLYHNDELLSTMTFGSLRIALGNENKKDAYEMYRFCSKMNTNVVGAAGKLLKYFVDNYKPEKIISYADRRWSNGNLYEKLGFKLLNKTKPNYFYTKDHYKKHHRFSFRKNILNKKLEKFDPSLSEWENMQLNGYDRIWDCGNLKYELTAKTTH